MKHQPVGESLSEVLARVAFRRVVQDFRVNPKRYDTPRDGMIDLAAELERSGFRALAWWVLAAAYYTHREGLALSQWRDWCCIRARLHQFDSAKNRHWTRRKPPYPPVSNTGVRGIVVRSPWGHRRARWSDAK